MPFYTSRFRMPAMRGHVFLPELVKIDKGNGNVEICIEQVDQSKELPDFALFDLKNQMDAGVKLEQVNYKMFSADTFPVDGIMSENVGDSKNDNKQEQTNNQEQINNGEN